VLRTLNRSATLFLPDTHAGTVEVVSAERIVPLGYGDVLLSLAPLASDLVALASRTASQLAYADDLPAGCRALLAPTDGVFYRRPDPASPPFVEPGERIRSGQPIGLVEVMKTFNQIAYGGPGLPEEALVVEFRREDGDEIARGDILVVVR
jgi:biotin carboxyl carrier protein